MPVQISLICGMADLENTAPRPIHQLAHSGLHRRANPI
jgi:hypothetical protein